ncbi:hypothetical protein B0H67DRAFT_649256 [Lasiosphaeris hirsuta]|uniref:2EXR domain-containing protein n=1 Tax=Lasiosphaeris hirsuta TaxID=260670 RepID=A0AA40DIJ1_9PEZI|nr:hypothetical protein B0H67DRAFT_649256 [Lasiosphaeris hirsuta]
MESSTSSATVEPPKLETFELFPNLPNELKRMIWRTAASVPRIIVLDREPKELVSYPVEGQPEANDDPTISYTKPGQDFTRLCPLLHVNHSSRDAVRTIYFTVFQLLDETHLKKCWRSEYVPKLYRVYDIAEHDVVVCSNSFYSRCEAGPLISEKEKGYEQGKDKFHPPTVRLIQRRRPGVIVSPSQTPRNFINIRWLRFDPDIQSMQYIQTLQQYRARSGNPRKLNDQVDPWEHTPCIKHVCTACNGILSENYNVGQHPEFRRVLAEAVAQGVVPGTPLVNGNPLRHALIARFCLEALQASALANPANHDCVARVYLGRRPAALPRVPNFSLRDYSFCLDQLLEFGLLVEALVLVHWAARVGGYDVEFVLGGQRVGGARYAVLDDGGFGGTELRDVGVLCNVEVGVEAQGRTSENDAEAVVDPRGQATQLWVLDYNLCSRWNEETVVEHSAKVIDQLVVAFRSANWRVSSSPMRPKGP